jgi:AraC-like DNA-binding protein
MTYEERLQAGEDPAEINVSASVYVHGSQKNTTVYPRHLHTYYELMACTNVRRPFGVYELDDRFLTIDQDCLLFIPPLCVHGFHPVISDGSLVVQFSSSFLGRNAFSMRSHKCLSPTGELAQNGFIATKAYPRLLALLQKMYAFVPTYTIPMSHQNQVIHYTPEYEILLNGITLELLWVMLDENLLAIEDTLLDEEETNILQKIMRQIIECPEKLMSKIDAAQLANMSCSTFSRTFMQAIGVNYNDFCNQMRIRRAQELIVGTSMPFTDIAYDLSFGNTSYFNRIFLRHTGMTPSDYRRICRERTG